MVRVSTWLCRVPVIKFRKGGGGGGGGHAAPASAAPKIGSCPIGAPAAQGQPAAAMSTGSIPDIDLPARYRRQPLSEEEIDHINGGGDDPPRPTKKNVPKMLGQLKIPKGILISGRKGKEVVTLNIVLSKE